MNNSHTNLFYRGNSDPLLNYSLFSFILISLSFFPTQAQADQWYFSTKLSYFETETYGLNNPENIGLAVSHDWNLDHGSVGIEGSYTTSFVNGSLGLQKVEIDTFGLYGVYCTCSPDSNNVDLYFKFKLGPVRSNLTIGDTSQSDTVLSAGLGLGVDMLDTSFELEYAIMSKKVNMVSIILRF